MREATQVFGLESSLALWVRSLPGDSYLEARPRSALARQSKSDVYTPAKLESKEASLLIKKTAKNQVTIPKALLDQLPPTDDFEAEVAGDALVLRPVKVVELVDIGRVRSRIKRAGVELDEVERAVQWARKKE